MKSIYIDKSICDNSPTCPARHSCPQEAIKFLQKSVYIDEEKCIECGECINSCPRNAIKVRKQK